MTLDFSEPGKAKCTMEGNIQDLLRVSGVTGKVNTPSLDNLFEIDESPSLTDELREEFHSLVVKLFVRRPPKGGVAYPVQSGGYFLSWFVLVRF